MALIELQQISKSFEINGEQIQALENINLSIEQSDIYGIIGMSGAGKSTLIRCLNYLERPTSGEVIIDGKVLSSLSIKELRRERSDISMIFQHFNLLMQKNVINNVAFPLKIRKIKKKEATKRAMELLDVVGLSDKANVYPAQLSGGQKQRVAIARALASNPKILLCDEATSALDPRTTESILNLLKQINKEYGITIVIITHQMDVIQKICNKVAIIEKGKLVEEGKVEEIFAKPKSKAAKKLILGKQNLSELDVKEKINLSEEIKESKKLRVVFSDSSAFEPVIANMILQFQTAVNILQANTKNVGGIAKGEMILGLPKNEQLQSKIEAYLIQQGLTVQEVTNDV